jgi:hypothetical protein
MAWLLAPLETLRPVELYVSVEPSTFELPYSQPPPG